MVFLTRAAAIIHTAGRIKAARPSTRHGMRAGTVGAAGRTLRLRRSSAGRYRRRPGGLFILTLTLELVESEPRTMTMEAWLLAGNICGIHALDPVVHLAVQGVNGTE